jgi:hypothetical protein
VTMNIFYTIMMTVLLSSILSVSLQVESGCDKEVECHVCQKTVYNLKFNYKTDCSSNSRCKSTCFKVIEQWNSPGTVFDGFIKDTIGKCDVCHKAGFCSAEQCKEQTKKTEAIIHKTVDAAELHGTVNTTEMDVMIGKILDKENVDFDHFKNKVQKDVKKAIHATKFLKNKKNVAKSLKSIVDYEDHNDKEELETTEEKQLDHAAHVHAKIEHKNHHKTATKNRRQLKVAKASKSHGPHDHHDHHEHHDHHDHHHGDVNCHSSPAHIQKAKQHAMFKAGKTTAKLQDLKRLLKRTKVHAKKQEIVKQMKVVIKKVQKEKKVVKGLKKVANGKTHSTPKKSNKIAKMLNKVVKKETHKIQNLLKEMKRKDISSEIKAIVMKSLKSKLKAVKKIKKQRKIALTKESPEAHAHVIRGIIETATNNVIKDKAKLKLLIALYKKTVKPSLKAVIKRVIKRTIESFHNIQKAIKKLSDSNPCEVKGH